MTTGHFDTIYKGVALRGRPQVQSWPVSSLFSEKQESTEVVALLVHSGRAVFFKGECFICERSAKMECSKVW